MSTGPKTDNEDQREQQLTDVARLYLMGQSQASIGRQLGVTQQQISYDLKIVRARWLESSLRDFNDAKAQELAKIDRIEAEFWAGWERSQRIKQVDSKKSRVGSKDVYDENAVRTEEQVGDPRFLDGAMKCVWKRCEILGLDAPKKTAFTNPDGTVDYGPFLPEDDRRSRLLAAFLDQGADGGTGQAVM